MATAKPRTEAPKEKPTATKQTPKVAFKKSKQVTLPILKKEDDVPVYVRIDSEIFTGKEVKGNSANNAKMQPARLVNVTELTTGEQMQMIVNTVLESILNENYAGGKYIGKCFEIVQYQPTGKKYKNYRVAEGELAE